MIVLVFFVETNIHRLQWLVDTLFTLLRYAPEAHWTNHEYTEDEAYGNAETGRESPPSRIRHDFVFSFSTRIKFRLPMIVLVFLSKPIFIGCNGWFKSN